MTNDDTAWIAERAKCDMDKLAACVRQLVKQNVTAMNVECNDLGWPPFKYTPLFENPMQFAIMQDRHTQHRSCEWQYDAGVMTVTMTTPDRVYTMQTRWDGEAVQCRVVVARPTNGEQDPVEFPHNQLGKAVSCILEPFFFPPR